MDLASLAPLAQLSAVGALVLVIVFLIRAIVRGDFVPRRELDYLRQDRDARLQEKDEEISEWRNAAATERTAREVAMGHETELIAGFATLNRTLDALRLQAAANHRHDGTQGG